LRFPFPASTGSVGIFGEAWQQDGEKWTKLGRSWPQEWPRCCQDGQLGHLFVGFGRISVQCWLIFGVVFAAGWEVAQSMKTNNTPSLLLDFHGLGGYFSAALGKVGASGGVLWALGGLVDDLVGIFGEAWQQD